MSALLYILPMPHEEKRTWITGVVAVVAYTAYLVIISVKAQGIPLAGVSYAATLLWTVGGAIAVSILLDILTGLGSPRHAGQKDQRDREISRFGEHAGHSFIVLGGVAALLMALAELGHFWIANVLYLGFVLSAIIGSTAKIVAYRRGLWPW
jgi:hypothetical protein